MEPRARAGKNLGKANFTHGELTQLLYAHGDVRQPLPETVRVLDEILTDFMQSIAFEATRAAHYSGRQKIKYEDFEFAFRKNPAFLGRVQETFEKQKMIKKARDIGGEDEILKEAAEEEKRREKAEAKSGGGKGGGSTSTAATTMMAAAGGSNGVGGDRGQGVAAARVEEELGEADDDDDAELYALGKKN